MPRSLTDAAINLDPGQNREAAEFGIGLDPFGEADSLLPKEDEYDMMQGELKEDFTF